MVRPTDAYGDQLALGPRHGAQDGAGRRALEAYQDFDGPGAPTPPPRRRRLVDYPRQGRRGWTRWIPSWRVFVSLFLLGVAALTAVFLVLYLRTDLPSRTNADALFQTTIVYDADHHEIGRFAAQNRVWVPLQDIPVTVQHAVLSAEDRTFYTNQGVSVTSVIRAALNNLRGGSTQGGSTITQQYVKNAYSSTTDRSYTRKLNEFFVSLKAAQELDKNQILERYLNIIYFGRGCYGIQAAASCYFHTDVKHLSPSQAAYLAGIINGPELYDSGTPAAKAAAKARWSYVLDGMVTENWLSAQDRAKQPFPKVYANAPTTTSSAFGTQQRYVMDMVEAEAAQMGITDADLQRNGYHIFTTFRPSLVDDAAKNVSSVLGPRKSWPTGTQVAITTIDVKTGAIVSVYGGDGKRAQNAATQDIVQAGSTFKPFGLVAALEGKRDPGDCTPKAPDGDSLSLRSRFDGHSPQTFDGFDKPVTNFGNEQFGQIDLVKATEESVNTVFVALNQKIGPEHTRDVAMCAGYPKNTQDLSANAANILGTSAPHPIDVAQAFSTLAAQGVRHDSYVISKIVSAQSGAVIRQHDPAATEKQVFDKGVIADATYAMQAVVQHGTGFEVSRLGRPVAGKTGTTSGNKSAWFAGFTPQYATVVAMYRIGPHGQQLSLKPWAGAGSEVTGGTLPAKVWTAYMGDVLQGVPVEDFPQPTYGGQDVNPAPSFTATPAPSTSSTPQPSRPQPSATGSPTPSPSTSPEPSPTASPSPTSTRTRPPSPRPVPSPSG